MSQPKKPAVNRREFMKRAAVASAALAAPVEAAVAQTAAPEPARVQEPEPLTEGRSGSDFMVDVMKTLDLDYVCANPGSSFRGLHESIINYGGNRQPELITCCHE